MYSRLLKAPEKKSFFLFGPRGTGKTTWVKAKFPQATYIDLLEDDLFNDFTARPQRLQSFIPPDTNQWVIIDEIQRVPSLLHEVHRLIESKKIRFILTGSSARKLRHQGTNLLAGRALTLSMFPLTAAETGPDFDLGRALAFGQLPSVYSEENPKKYLESYVRTYLEEEVKQEGLTRNLSAFARFLETASFSQGSVLNISSIARECAIERKVAENYFNILEDLLIGYRLPVFSRRAKRRLIAHPKFYFFDAGIFRTLRPTGPLDAISELEGGALETLFLQEFKAINASLDLGYNIYYWRTSNDQEVDFVLYGPKGLLAFEIKRSDRFKPEFLSGLRSFLRDYPMAKAHLIYLGSRKLHETNVTVIPALEAIKNLTSYL
jgi:uncharacterized protein